MCKELSPEYISTHLSQLVLMDQSLSRISRTGIIISQITRSKGDYTFSLSSIDIQRKRIRRGSFNFVVSVSKILFGILSGGDATYY
jgi:hypothetical protein